MAGTLKYDQSNITNLNKPFFKMESLHKHSTCIQDGCRDLYFLLACLWFMPLKVIISSFLTNISFPSLFVLKETMGALGRPLDHAWNSFVSTRDRGDFLWRFIMLD